MFGVDYRYIGESEYRTLGQGYDTYAEAALASADLKQIASIEEVVVTESDPFDVESWNER